VPSTQPVVAGTAFDPPAATAACTTTSGLSPAATTRNTLQINGCALSMTMEVLDCSPSITRLGAAASGAGAPGWRTPRNVRPPSSMVRASARTPSSTEAKAGSCGPS
jgi:hypothetical protein